VLLISAVVDAHVVGAFGGNPLGHLLGRMRKAQISFISDMLLVVGMIGAYALWIYPIIPAMYGGAERPVVEVFLKESQTVSNALPTGMKLDKNRIGPVRLMFESSDGVFISPLTSPTSDRSLVRLRRDLIDAILYHQEP
jgi:hypothetical protein